MEQQKSLKEIADEVMKIKGNVKGEAIRTDFIYVLEKKGEEGIRLIEEKYKQLGYEFKFKDIKSFGWYPESYSVLLSLIIMDVFGWTEKDIFEMGNCSPKYSFIVRTILHYFVSVDMVFKEVPVYWKKHYDFGEIEAVELNKIEKYLVFRVKDYKFHPIMCIYQSGYFLRIGQYSIQSPKITVEELKCVFKGAPYHEYRLSWK